MSSRGKILSFTSLPRLRSERKVKGPTKAHAYEKKEPLQPFKTSPREIPASDRCPKPASRKRDEEWKERQTRGKCMRRSSLGSISNSFVGGEAIAKVARLDEFDGLSASLTSPPPRVGHLTRMRDEMMPLRARLQLKLKVPKHSFSWREKMANGNPDSSSRRWRSLFFTTVNRGVNEFRVHSRKSFPFELKEKRCSFHNFLGFFCANSKRES